MAEVMKVWELGEWFQPSFVGCGLIARCLNACNAYSVPADWFPHLYSKGVGSIWFPGRCESAHRDRNRSLVGIRSGGGQ